MTVHRVAIPVALSLFAAIALSACRTSIESGIESANDLLYNKQYSAAEALYYKLLKRLGENDDLNETEDEQRLLILDKLGKINALYLHDYTRAIGFYLKLVQLYPKTEQAFAARATIADIYHHKLGNLEAAIAEYQKLVAEFPDRTETRWAQLQIAQAFFQQRNFEQARTEAEVLIHRWPESSEAAQARFQIANSYYVQGRYAEAIATYERLLEGDPDPSLASLVLFELGNCFQEVDDPDRALAYYYACLSDHPNPLLVQRKIRRVRARLHRTRPITEISLPEYVAQRLAVAQQGGGIAPIDEEPVAAPRPGREAAVTAPPEAGVFRDSSFEANEGGVRADSPAGNTKAKPAAPRENGGAAPAGANAGAGNGGAAAGSSAPAPAPAAAPAPAPAPAPSAPPPDTAPKEPSGAATP